ncbi:hypothetical protein BGZ65_011322 [Modicella reniformis]|uniref:Crinkler effector protein N-terminal domain-containing protein n=1 Tax=Modicella reniformis TaxID=1440133 RepID=A0A9P6SRQ0_9FUNG|nr:hypothetical protein BGZ65_011322 [Modicella reniformis]
MALTLFCAVDGESNPFSVEVDPTKSVDVLKKAIKTNKSHEFDDIDANKLTLWKVLIPYDSVKKHLKFDLGQLQANEKEKLDPISDTSDVFGQETTKKPAKMISIIVERPPPDNKRKGSEEHRESSKYHRTFSPANETYPGLHYYIEPLLAKVLSKRLLESKFCLVYGHRQSGKSTAMFAALRYLQKQRLEISGFGLATPDVYVVSFKSGIDVDHGIDAFWRSVCQKLHVSNPTLFSLNESTWPSVTFEGFFGSRVHPVQ